MRTLADLIQSTGRNPSVAVWKNEALPASETFIRNQMSSLQRWDSQLFGLYGVASLLSRDDDQLVLKAPNGLVLRLARLLGAPRRTARMMKDANVDLIHAHFAPSGWTVLGAARRLGRPLIVTLHGVDVTALAERRGVRASIYRWRLRRVLSACDLALAVSDFIRQKTLSYCPLTTKVVTHYIGIPIPPDSSSTEKSWDLLFVGRFVDKKGIDDLLVAVDMLAKKGLELSVGLVGDGPTRPAMEQLATKLGLNVNFLGPRSPDYVANAMSEARIGVVPSRVGIDGDCEGLPTVAMEFSARSVPVVGTYHSGIPEIVLDGVTGLLAPERDPRCLAAHIERLLGDAGLRESMGRSARAHVVKNFDIVSQTRLLEEHYDSVLEKIV